MKISNTFKYILILLVIVPKLLSAQAEFTPYDELPGIIKINKPTMQKDFPHWAKMLYDFPVNYFEICNEYEKDKSDKKSKWGSINRYFKDWKRVMEAHVRENGQILIPDIMNYNQELYQSQLRKQNNSPSSNRNEGNWSFVGPIETYWLNESGANEAPSSCPWQVNIYSFDVSESDPNILYCGTETGFVNKSTDKGLSWDLCSLDYYFGGGVTAVAIHPNDPNTVFVAAGKQVHKSIDGGQNWQALVEPSNLFYANRLKINNENGQHLVASSAEGVFSSFDGGNSWTKALGLKSYDVEFSPLNPSIIYALASENENFAFYISTNQGISFEKANDFPSGIPNASGGMLAVSPADPDMILALLLSENNTPLLYEKKKNESGWDLLASGNTSQLGLNNGQGYFDLVLEISPLDAKIIFAGTTTLFKSSNGGQSFNAIGGYQGSFAIHPDIQDMKLLKNGESWVSTDGGFSLSTDEFTNTNNYDARNNALVGSDMWGFGQGWNEDIMVGGRYHNGNTAIGEFYQPKALRMGGAESPTGWVMQGRSRHVAFNDLGNGWILPETAESKPEGRFIFSKYPNMDEYGGRRGNMVFHPNYYGEILLGEGNGLWKSTDMGITFDLIYDFNAKIRYLDISYKNPNVLYADIIGKGLYKSEDGGYSWERKASLTSGNFGSSYWNGKLFFVISPYDENKIYACLQNGTWSADIGKVFKSNDGGNTWEDWTGELEEYTKCLVIQPSSDGDDIVYLFSRARNEHAASVYVRKENESTWKDFSNGFPAGMAINLALPFYRDGKIRVAGNAGVWETPMVESNFPPFLNPWVEKKENKCMSDTLLFDDHSMLNHENATWNWTITPEPLFISDKTIRNPIVVLGEKGSYDVQMDVTINGDSTYSTKINELLNTTTCPSIDDCNNPAFAPKENWQLKYVDSEEINYPGRAFMAFDGDPSTIWHTRWSTGSDPYPHEIQIELDTIYNIYEFILLNRQNGQNGRIKDYELYISDDPENWGDAVSSGQLQNTAAPQSIKFDEALSGKYIRLLALSEVNDNAWSSIAEIDLIACIKDLTKVQKSISEHSYAFPLPANNQINISLPENGSMEWTIYSMDGRLVKRGKAILQDHLLNIDITDIETGYYILNVSTSNGKQYRAKILKGN